MYVYHHMLMTLTRKRTELASETSYPIISIPLSVVKGESLNLFLKKGQIRWSLISPHYYRRRAQKVLRTPHHSIFKLVLEQCASLDPIDHMWLAVDICLLKVS